MKIILTYDVDAAHNTVVKNTLKAAPYSYTDIISGVRRDGTTHQYKLPNTTLYHADKTVDTAETDIATVAANCGAKLEKWVAIEVSNYRVNDPA